MGLVGWEWGPKRRPDPVTAMLCDLGLATQLAGYSFLLTADPRSRQGESPGIVEKPGHREFLPGTLGLWPIWA